ncbi:MAG: LapA family protein [Qingshengfaniella sp.]
MRTIKYLILALIALALVIIGFANRQVVTLTLLPPDLVPFTKFNYALDLPLYVVAFGFMVLGFVLGEVFEWLREAKYRSQAARERRERAVLAAEVKKLQNDKNMHKDDVLALIE